MDILRVMGMEVPVYAQRFESDEYHTWLEELELPKVKRGHIYQLLQRAHHVELRSRIAGNEEIITVTMVIQR